MENYLNLRFWIVWFSLVLFGFFSCKTKKSSEIKTLPKKENTSLAASKQTFYLAIEQAKNAGEGIRYMAEADYKEGKTDVNLNIEFIAKKDQYIWLNAKALGIVSVARVLIKPDSIRILDLVNKKYISASYQYLKRFTTAPLGFKELENLVWGNALFDPIPEITTVDSSNNGFLLGLTLNQVFQKSQYGRDFKNQYVWLTEQGSPRAMTVKYEHFQQVGKNSFPEEIVINIDGEKKVECKFTLNNFATDVKTEPNFSVPKSYKVEVFR